MVFRLMPALFLGIFLCSSTAFAQEAPTAKDSRPKFVVSLDWNTLTAMNWRLTGASLNGRSPIAAVQDIAVFADAEAGIYEYGEDSPLDTTVEKFELGVGINAYRLGHLVRVGFGSVSDELFNSSDEMYFSILALFKVYERAKSSWHIGAMYNSSNDFPYPVLYYLFSTPDLYLQLGLPFNLEWQIDDRWSLRPTTVRFTSSMRSFFITSTRPFLRPESRVQVDTIAIADRPDEDEYFFVRTGRAGLAAHYNSTRATVGMTFFAGALFDGEYFTGEDSTDNDGATDINDGFVTMVTVWARF
ncbi:MAG: hypothetical protein U5N86_10725 [Planctomycetota bacterium]|nr:hypothetical protein [Planctomycetota bacterium]